MNDALARTEIGNCTKRLKLFVVLNDIVSRAPSYYSALNNRYERRSCAPIAHAAASAQVFQLLKRPADAMTDLTSAIQHAERTGNTLVARQAYTQRGSHLLAARIRYLSKRWVFAIQVFFVRSLTRTRKRLALTLSMARVSVELSPSGKRSSSIPTLNCAIKWSLKQCKLIRVVPPMNERRAAICARTS